MALSATYVTASDAPHHFDVCTCGHLRSAHRGTRSCLTAVTKTTGAKGTVSASSICPCVGFVADGRRWVPPTEPKLRVSLKRGDIRVDHAAGLIT